GSWRRAYPDVACGLKRGFSYFHHRAGEAFVPQDDHSNELLVAANPDEEHGDTHWHRADVDHFFVREVQAAGIPYFDRTQIDNIENGEAWRITAERDGEAIGVTASLVVDASGQAGVLARALGIQHGAEALNTNSRTIYAHFRGVRLWHDVYAEIGGKTFDHPFPCDAAALHHVFDGGWMFVLRFDNGVTSAGFVLDRNSPEFGAGNDTVSPEDEWAILLRRFPSIARQFDGAQLVEPLRRTGPLQRLASRIAGPNWAMLPHTAYFLDPLHSAGNAHTLSGTERLMRILAESWDGADRAPRLAAYERTMRREVALLDSLIHGCYTGFARFELMAAFSMLYFAAATLGEHRRRTSGSGPEVAFLNSDNPGFTEAVTDAYTAIRALAGRPVLALREVSGYYCEVAGLIAPYNVAGLCDPARRNMYPYMEAEPSLTLRSRTGSEYTKPA
ncbi:MAG: NAD(P)/FAD-dependent oxidoreductase, partial [Gammaproteobacteria bacterium]